MPPLRCCTFLTLLSTTMVPLAMTAPAIWVVAAQPPTPAEREHHRRCIPTRFSLRIAYRGLRWDGGHRAASVGRAADDLEAGVGRGDGRLRRHIAQDLVAGTEGVLRAVAQHQHLVANRQHCGAMRDQDDDGAARLGVTNRPEQRRFPLAVEIGVRLIEHDQKRIAVQCPRQRHPLALPGRQNRAASPMRVS